MAINKSKIANPKENWRFKEFGEDRTIKHSEWIEFILWKMGIKFSADGKSIKEIISETLIGLGNNLAYNRITFIEYRKQLALLGEISNSIKIEFEKEGPKVVGKIDLRKEINEDMYHIYHVINPDFIENMNARVMYVGSVRADSLQKAYKNAQNFDSPWHDSKTRSTSVGDFIKEDADDYVYMVCGSGFKSIGGINELNVIANESDLKAECEQNSLESQMDSEY